MRHHGLFKRVDSAFCALIFKGRASRYTSKTKRRFYRRAFFSLETYATYSLYEGVRRYPTRLRHVVRTGYKLFAIGAVVAVLVTFSVRIPLGKVRNTASLTPVPGESYDICDEQSTYLTSPWTYSALASGSQTYTVDEYHKLNLDGTENATAPGSAYGTALPELPSYILAEDPATTAAVIFAPGSTAISNPAYDFPNSPLLYFFEGGAYGEIALSAVSGDEFIGGAASGYPEPMFNDGGNAGGIDAQNGSYDFSGGQGALATTATVGTTTLTTTAQIPGYLQFLNFADGTSYQIASTSGDTITLSSPLTQAESTGAGVWASRAQPVSFVASAASQGATTITLTSSTIPLMQYATAAIGGDSDIVQSVSGSQSSYTLTLYGGLDQAVAAGTPVYYNGNAGNVTVEYLDINNDQHTTTGTIYTGSGGNGEGWTIEHNNIHDGYSKGSGYGVALYGGDEATIEYNCLSKMGDYGINAFGTNTVFDYNEIYESNYEADPGCGCSGGGKWWGTLNADIKDNAFIGNGYGGGGAIWLDNGNSGTLISGNYFDKTYGQAISSETGFNLDITTNLFEDDNWGGGTGCGNSNCAGDLSINTSGGVEVPGSRYENEILVSDNQFLNDWGGVGIWQSGSRSCENSGESWEPDAPYCSGGFPITNTTTAGGSYYFSHEGDEINGGTGTVAADASAGSSTVLVQGNEAIDDQIDFQNPSSTATTDTTNVTSFTGSGTVTVGSTNGFPGSGQLFVATSTGNAILAYTGTSTSTGVCGGSATACFTGVSLVSDPDVADTGTLSGNIQVNDPAYTTTTTTTDVTAFTGSQTLAVGTTAGFPSSGQLRVGTSAAWNDGGGSYTGAILSYSGVSGNSFTGVSLVRGSGQLGSGGPTPVMEVPPYKVTGETCYANDCKVAISPALASSITAGDAITNAGTCQLYATSAATPTSPMTPVSSSSPYYESYWDGCQWEARNISATGNTFTVQPSVMDADTTLKGSSVSCTAANNCGTNFMSDQPGGEAPFNNQIGANAMMSNSSFSGCPSWDSGCSSDPLTDLNALSPPPGGAPANNGEAPYNNSWSDNTYVGPWSFNTFIYGNCNGSMPTDPTTGNTMSTSGCTATASQWQSYWQQDAGSTFNAALPPSVTLTSLADDDTIHGSSVSVAVNAAPNDGGSVTGASMSMSGMASQSTTGAPPYTFSLDTTGVTDGAHTITVTATDDLGDIGSSPVTVYVTNGDFNGDGKVDLSDLIILAQHYGKSGTFTYSQGNITGATFGTEVNLSDLIILARNYGYNDGLGH